MGNEGLLIDFGEEKKKEKDDWEDNLEDEAWQSLGKDDWFILMFVFITYLIWKAYSVPNNCSLEN